MNYSSPRMPQSSLPRHFGNTMPIQNMHVHNNQGQFTQTTGQPNFQNLSLQNSHPGGSTYFSSRPSNLQMNQSHLSNNYNPLGPSNMVDRFSRINSSTSLVTAGSISSSQTPQTSLFDNSQSNGVIPRSHFVSLLPLRTISKYNNVLGDSDDDYEFENQQTTIQSNPNSETQSNNSRQSSQKSAIVRSSHQTTDKGYFRNTLSNRQVSALLPEEINLPARKRLTILDLANVGLQVLSPKLWNSFSFLTELYLSSNHLTFLPDEFCKNMTKLRILDLSSNQLKSLPSSMSRLDRLEQLFLGSNQIRSIPLEIGQCFRLVIFDLSNNPVQYPPANVFQQHESHTQDLLRTLKQHEISIDNAMRNMTPLPKAPEYQSPCPLVAWLRDHMSDPPKPAPRSWIVNTSCSPNPNAVQFTVLSRNCLSDTLAVPTLFSYTPSWALDWNHRSKALLADFVEKDTDFICLQEIESGKYDPDFAQPLANHGYRGIFSPKGRYHTLNSPTVDGCATFYKKSKFRLVETMCTEFRKSVTKKTHKPRLDDQLDALNRLFPRDNIAVIAIFELLQVEKNSTFPRYLMLVNTHIHWDPEYSDVKMMQTQLLMEIIQDLVYDSSKIWNKNLYYHIPNFSPTIPTSILQRNKASLLSKKPTLPFKMDSVPKTIPVVIAGDFNSTPDSGVYQLMTHGFAHGSHEEMIGKEYGEYTKRGLIHNLHLSSALGEVLHHEPAFTNFTKSFKQTLDYIWFSPGLLSVSRILEPINQENNRGPLLPMPNPNYPSDHISLVCDFQLNAL